MLFRTATEDFKQDITKILRDDLSDKAKSRDIAEFARQRLMEAEQINKAVLGKNPPYKVFVDGRLNAPLESVKPAGVIEFVWDETLPIVVVERGLEWLREESPVVSGTYRDSHTLYVNGSPAARLPEAYRGEEIMISNPVPYARKIEVGRTRAGRAFVIQVPNRIYERVARRLQQRFDNVAAITFAWVPLTAGVDRSPAILIKPR